MNNNIPVRKFPVQFKDATHEILKAVETLRLCFGIRHGIAIHPGRQSLITEGHRDLSRLKEA